MDGLLTDRVRVVYRPTLGLKLPRSLADARIERVTFSLRESYDKFPLARLLIGTVEREDEHCIYTLSLRIESLRPRKSGVLTDAVANCIGQDRYVFFPKQLHDIEEFAPPAASRLKRRRGSPFAPAGMWVYHQPSADPHEIAMSASRPLFHVRSPAEPAALDLLSVVLAPRYATIEYRF